MKTIRLPHLVAAATICSLFATSSPAMALKYPSSTRVTNINSVPSFAVRHDRNSEIHLEGRDFSSVVAFKLRGGGLCAPGDTDGVVALKTAASASLEALGLLGAFKLAEVTVSFLEKQKFFEPLRRFTTKIGGLPFLQWVSAMFVVFSSSTVKTWLQGGVIGAATNQVLKPNVVPGDANWYSSLKKPWFNPPGWAFPIMWLLVSKPTQLMALRRIFLKQNSGDASNYWPQLAVYCLHLALGDAWNDVFFGCQRVGLGAAVITTFFGMLLTSTKLFSDIDAGAGKLMLPTCGCVTVATALNLSIYQMNK